MPCGAMQISALGENDSPLRALSNKAVEVLAHMPAVDVTLVEI